MCGIAGVIRSSIHPAQESDEQLTAEALQRIRYRGPDNTRQIRHGHCVLGHNRLSILDLSDKANQPMSDESGRYSIAFNGEIFNHASLRSKMESGGTRFQTKSDTEVLLQLLILKGEEALQELNGFFAFAFHDRMNNRLLLARDRYGEKPIYYHHTGQDLTFASELKALQVLTTDQEIDVVSLSMLFQFGYIPAPHSIFKGIYKLEPAHCIIYEDGVVTTRRWYHPDTSITAAGRKEEIIPSFSSLLRNAVDIRMNADVPVGCFLSGGADSSVIALLASENRSISTFSLGFTDSSYLDETRHAKKVAAHIGSNHQAMMMSSDDMLSEVQFVLENMDEPFSDSSSIAVSLLSRAARKHVTVALSGDGADELLGGYHKYVALQRTMKNNLANTLISLIHPVLRILPQSRTSAITNRFRQINKYSGLLDQNIKQRYLTLASWAPGDLCEKIINQEIALRRGARLNTFVQDIRQDDFNTMLIADQHLVLSNDMLTKVDRMSMLHSLEIRPPFLDHRLIEFVNQIHTDFKVFEGQKKILLREAFASRLPEEVFKRNKKGFEVPLEKWLRTDLRPMVMDLLGTNSLLVRDFLQPHVVQRVLNDFYKRDRREHSYLIYSMMVFENWYRKFKK